VISRGTDAIESPLTAGSCSSPAVVDIEQSNYLDWPPKKDASVSN
jgi:hypothetical protein